MKYTPLSIDVNLRPEGAFAASQGLRGTICRVQRLVVAQMWGQEAQRPGL
jgi:hypothetical protein